MKIEKMSMNVFLVVGILGLATGPVWAGKPKAAAAPESKAADTKEFDKGATDSPQTVTTVESDNAGFYLSGTGPRWTLVTAPQHGTMKLWLSKSWAYQAWTPGTTELSDINPLDAEVARGVHSVGYVLYYPTPGYVGPDAFTWHSGDASVTSKDVVCSITVTANHPPVANNQSVTCAQGVTNKYVALNYTHADSGGFADRYYNHLGQTMSFTLVSAPTHGTLKYYNGGKKNGSPQGDYLAVPAGKPIPYYGWSYTPNEGYSGSDSFTWKCNDTFVDSGTATATITVAPKGAVSAAKPAPVSKDGAYVGPGDIVPDAMAWYGVRGYSRAAAATGTQKAVRIVRFSDGASLDVLIKPNGDLDTAAAAAFCAGTLARVALWYDQSGHGNDIMGGCQPCTGPLLTTFACSKMTKVGTPYSEFTLDSLPCVEIPGDDRQFTNTKIVGASPVGTFSAVASRRSTGFGGMISEMNGAGGRSAGVSDLQFVAPGFNQASLSVSIGYGGGTKIMTGVDETDRDAFHSFQGVVNGASSVLNLDGTPTYGNLEPANLANSFWSGGCSGGGGFLGKIAEEGVWPTVFSADEQAAMYQNQRNYWHLPAVAGIKRGVTAASNARQAPPIDGTLASRFWWINPALLLGKVESTDIGPLQTTAYVLVDKQNLYVAWNCLEKDTDDLVVKATERDGDLRSDDSVEMFLSPDEKTYYHFAVNSKGVFADGKGVLNQKEDLTWNSTATVKASVDKGRGWTVTMSLPLSDLAPTSGKSQKWMLNFNRTKPMKDQAGKTTFIQSSWSSAGHGNYADASGWGKLTDVNIQ